VNAITSTLFTAELLADEDRNAKDAARPADSEGNVADGAEGAGTDGDDFSDQVFDWAVDDKDDAAIYFEPSRGNVIFGSALDGWGFSTADFAVVLAKKFKCRPDVLARVLWGDYYVTKEKGRPTVKRGAAAKGKPPLFATAVLSTVWDVYRAVCVDIPRDKAKIDKITASLGIKLSIRDYQSEDRRTALRAILGQWMPISRAVMAAVCDVIPPPSPMHADRVRTLLTSGRAIERASPEVRALAAELLAAPDPTTSTGTTLAFVSKMVAVDRSVLPVARAPVLSEADRATKRAALLARRRADGKDGGGEEQHTDAGGAANGIVLDAVELCLDGNPEGTTLGEGVEDEADLSSSVMIAYARVFSGRITQGQTIQVLGAAYNPAVPGEHVTETTIGKLFVLMGRELVEIQSAPVGMVVGILGLGKHIQKSATLASTLTAPSLAPMHFVGTPIVRVALETTSIAAMPALRRGLKLLHQADPGNHRLFFFLFLSFPA
jgi:ribosome assembly protein 1